MHSLVEIDTEVQATILFLTSTTALAQGLQDSQIAPIFSISWRCFLTSSYWCGGPVSVMEDICQQVP